MGRDPRGLSVPARPELIVRHSQLAISKWTIGLDSSGNSSKHGVGEPFATRTGAGFGGAEARMFAASHRASPPVSAHGFSNWVLDSACS